MLPSAILFFRGVADAFLDVAFASLYQTRLDLLIATPSFDNALSLVKPQAFKFRPIRMFLAFCSCAAGLAFFDGNSLWPWFLRVTGRIDLEA